MTCIITGCAFLPRPNEWIAGDLYEIADTYVFVGNYDGQSLRPKVNFGESFYDKTVTAESFLERRGVFIMEKSATTLSPEAVEYIKAAVELLQDDATRQCIIMIGTDDPKRQRFAKRYYGATFEAAMAEYLREQAAQGEPK